MIYTSLKEIYSFEPCANGWKNILRGQKKTVIDEVLFPLTEAVESNSIADVCWLLGKKETEIQVAVRFARMCADSVAHLITSAATYAVEAAAEAADDAATYAAEDAAADAAYAADDAATYAADATQVNKNKQFLILCITEYEAAP